MPSQVLNLSEDELTKSLTYAGFILLAYELVKSLIVDPIKLFYRDAHFTSGPFSSYEKDVLRRHKNEFEACLMYLRDFMETIDSRDVVAIQGLRKHRNELAHELPTQLQSLEITAYAPLLQSVDQALFKLSNHRTYMEIGHDPEFQNQGIDWNTVYGEEYMIFKEVLEKVRILQG